MENWWTVVSAGYPVANQLFEVRSTASPYFVRATFQGSCSQNIMTYNLQSPLISSREMCEKDADDEFVREVKSREQRVKCSFRCQPIRACKIRPLQIDTSRKANSRLAEDRRHETRQHNYVEVSSSTLKLVCYRPSSMCICPYTHPDQSLP
jgi:hypothetical protein